MTLFPNHVCVPKHINESQKNKGKGNYELNWNERSHQSMAQLGRATIVNDQLRDVIIIHDQSQMDYTATTQPLEGLHNNSQLLESIYSDVPSQQDHTKSCPNLKYALKIPKTDLPPTVQGLPFITLNTLSMDLKQPHLLTLALGPLWLQVVTTLFQKYTVYKFILQTISKHYPKPPPACIENKQLVEVKINDKTTYFGCTLPRALPTLHFRPHANTCCSLSFIDMNGQSYN